MSLKYALICAIYIKQRAYVMGLKYGLTTIKTETYI